MSCVIETLDVLLIESHPHGADVAAAELAAPRHRVRRCFAPGDRLRAAAS